jgi:hypothetical protein
MENRIMARTWTNFSSFREVVNHYNSIKPLVSKHHTREDDIRPIGDRNRKWDRIVKISNNCYALSDGYHYGDDKFIPWGLNNHPDRLGSMRRYAPIVWSRNSLGIEKVEIRNVTGDDSGYSIMRYDFLHRHMPQGMHFMRANARQYISLGGIYNGDKHFLAKGKTVPRKVWEATKDSKNRWDTWKQVRNDNATLVFTRDSRDPKSVGNWQRDWSTGAKLPSNPKVNKELKAKFKDAIDKLFTWGMTMSPLLPLENQDYRFEKMREIAEYFHPNVRYETWKPEFTHQILRDDNHPMRLNYWIMFAAECTDGWGWNPKYLVKQVETKDDLRRIRARYNSYMNNNAGFMTKK